MSLNAHSTDLNRGLDLLAVEETRLRWTDAVAQDFENRYQEPLQSPCGRPWKQ